MLAFVGRSVSKLRRSALGVGLKRLKALFTGAAATAGWEGAVAMGSGAVGSEVAA
jgi:hypothetical protein